MSRSWVGWVVGLAVGLAGGAVIGVVASDRDVQRRISESTKHLGDRVAEGAHDVRERGEEWRDRSVENFGRAVFQAAEARDATLNAVDDLDEDTGSIPQQSGSSEAM